MTTAMNSSGPDLPGLGGEKGRSGPTHGRQGGGRPRALPTLQETSLAASIPGRPSHCAARRPLAPRVLGPTSPNTTESERRIRGDLRITYGDDSRWDVGVWDGSPRSEGY